MAIEMRLLLLLYFWLGGGLDISWKGGGTIHQIVINLHRTYEKLHCKEEPYRLSGLRNPLVQTDTQILLLYYADITSIVKIPATCPLAIHLRENSQKPTLAKLK